MSIYLCRWPNGDISVLSGNSRLEIEDVLDEVGNPDRAELIPIKHAVAVHFRLKAKIESSFTVPDCLELDGIDEHLFTDVCGVYPFLDEVLSRENATSAEIVAAVKQEKTRMAVTPPELSDDPEAAMVQRLMDMPRRLAEHHNETATVIASKKK